MLAVKTWDEYIEWFMLSLAVILAIAVVLL